MMGEHTRFSCTVANCHLCKPQPPATGLVRYSFAYTKTGHGIVEPSDDGRYMLAADVEARDRAIIEDLRAMRGLNKDHFNTLGVQCFSDDEWWGREQQKGCSDNWIIDRLLAQLRGGGK